MGLTIAVLSDRLSAGFRESKRDSPNHPVAQLSRLIPQLGIADALLLIVGQDRESVLQAYPGYMFCMGLELGFARTTDSIANVLRVVRPSDDLLIIEADTNINEMDLAHVRPAGTCLIRAGGFTRIDRIFKGLFIRSIDRSRIESQLKPGTDLDIFYSEICASYPTAEIDANHDVHFEMRRTIPKHLELVLDQQ